MGLDLVFSLIDVGFGVLPGLYVLSSRELRALRSVSRDQVFDGLMQVFEVLLLLKQRSVTIGAGD